MVYGFRYFLVSRVISREFNYHQRKKFLHDAKSYFWEEPMLCKHCAYGMIRRCIPEEEARAILYHCHNLEMGGHFSTSKTVAKVWQSGFYWPIMYQDVREYIKSCDAC